MVESIRALAPARRPSGPPLPSTITSIKRPFGRYQPAVFRLAAGLLAGCQGETDGPGEAKRVWARCRCKR